VIGAPGWRTSSPTKDLVLPVRRLARHGFEAWSEVIARAYEGYVAKDETSL
jgi:hypothetical protein